MKRWLKLSVSWSLNSGLLVVGAALLVFAAGCGRLPAEGCDPDADCEESSDEPPVGVQSCDLATFDPDATGICIPYVDAGWHTALVKMAFPDEGPLHCPKTAPWAGLLGKEVVDPNTEPRNVIGCSVSALATCGSLAFACVPFEADFPACILQADQESCAGPYTLKTKVAPQGGGVTTTVCCIDPDDAH